MAGNATISQNGLWPFRHAAWDAIRIKYAALQRNTIRSKEHNASAHGMRAL